MKCPQHDLDLVNRKGVSQKTGKNYDFWACTAKTDGKFCDYTYNQTKSGASTSSMAPERTELIGKVLASIVSKLDALDRKIDEAVKEIIANMPKN